MKLTFVAPALRIFAVVMMFLLAVDQARADTVFNQPPDPAGGQYKSSWYPPDGLDSDQYVWDAFIVPSNAAITEVRWRGAYTNYVSSPVYDFTVSVYASNAGGFQPDVSHPPLVKYHTNSNAEETVAGTFGGVLMYDYRFTLPSPFQAAGGTKYWIQIEASQALTPNYLPPDWSFAKGTGGDGSHFRKIGGTGGNYNSISGDCAFMLLTAAGPTWTIDASAAPEGSGSVQGAGTYPADSQVTLEATANGGFGFQNWTENGSQVSANWRYTFTATRDRTLVANFVNAYTISTSSWPVYGGTTTGGGTYNEGTNVHVTATPREGYVFTEWTVYGASVSSEWDYSFPAGSDLPLVANFVPGPGTVPFDLDSGEPPPQTMSTVTPFDLTVDGVTAYFSSPQDLNAFILQTDATTWQHHDQLTGNYLWPSRASRNVLHIRFSRPVTAVSLDFCTVEMEAWADTPSPLSLTAYRGSTANPPVGSTQASGSYGPTTYPEGLLVFTSSTPFDLVVLTVGANPWSTVNFMADNISATVSCGADFDQSGFVDTDDFDAFVRAFEAGTDNADFDLSGFVDTDDFDAFVHAFEAGC